jgi:hypothetical protein
MGVINPKFKTVISTKMDDRDVIRETCNREINIVRN